MDKKNANDPSLRGISRLAQDSALNSIELPEGAFDTHLGHAIVRYHFIYATIGLTLGSLLASGGLLLFIVGIVGKSNMVANLLGAKIELTDAAPGAIIAAFGIVLAIATRFDVRIGSKGRRVTKVSAKSV